MATSVVGAFTTLQFVFMLSGTVVSIGTRRAARANQKILGREYFGVFTEMLASGASEQSMSQWASLFAESGLHVSKTMGDLLGPCAFAVFMGLARVYFGSRGGKIRLRSSLLVPLCYV